MSGRTYLETISESDLYERSLSLSRFWSNQLYGTGAANRQLVEDNLKLLYAAAGAVPPKTILWFYNPKAACRAANSYITNNLSKFYRERQIAQSMFTALPLSIVHNYIQSISIKVSGIRLSDDCREQWAWQRSPSIDLFDLLRQSVIFVDEASPFPELSVFRKWTDRILKHEWSWSPSRESDQWGMASSLFNTTRLRDVGYRAFLQELGVLPESNDGLEQILQSCGGFIAFSEVAMVVERPAKVVRDSVGRLHSETEPAITFGDGSGFYCLKNVLVPEFVITHPDSVTFDVIKGLSDWALKWILIQRFGIERYLNEDGIKPFQEDSFGSLYQLSKFRALNSFMVLKVVNKTPEPDGTFKSSFLTVPNLNSAREAVAWTFNTRPDRYDPTFES